MNKIKWDRLPVLIDQFLSWCDIEKGQSAVTVRGKYNKLTNMRNWFVDGKKDLTIDTLIEYKNHLFTRRMARTGAVKERVLSGVRTDMKSNILPFVSWLFDKGHIKNDWKKKIDLPPAHKKDSPVQSSDVIDQIIAFGTKESLYDSEWSCKRKFEYREALTFLARTGGRISVVLNLKKEDINIPGRVINVYSKGKVRNISFTEDLVEMMTRRSQGSGKAFDIKAANQQQMNEYLHKGCQELGISQDFTVHTLRHSKATNMLARGEEMYTVQKALGHESILTTINTYGHLNNFHAKQALDRDPMVQESLTLDQRKANIRAILETAGLTRLAGTTIKQTDTEEGIVVEFVMSH